MKKLILCLLVIIACCLGLVGCYQDLEETSLEEYILHINRNKFGYSNVGIDHPDNFLPSLTFIEDYEYIEGGYYWREEDLTRDLFKSKRQPEIVVLYLKYDEGMYGEAKQFMLKNIIPNDKTYIYNDYIFYENTNFNPQNGTDKVPQFFTMACYNDTKNVLVFIGMSSGKAFTSGSLLEDKYLTDLENHWTEFIDQYFGEYYDFSQ